MSFLTARRPSNNRVWDTGHILGSGALTWAHALRVAGYETSLIGRMHFLGPDQRHGFENRPIGEFGALHPGVPWTGGPAFTKYPSSASSDRRESIEMSGRGTTIYQWYDRKVARTAVAYLRDRARSGNRFAAVVGFMLPHCPYIAPTEFFDYYFSRVDMPVVEANQPATIKRVRQLRRLLQPGVAERHVRVARAAYFGLCEFHDAMVGAILRCVEETGLAKNTLVVYCADHGDTLGEHGCWWKSTYYEGSVGVPIIASLPGVVPAGTVSDAICNLMDLGPTFAEVAGTDLLADADGRSLWPTLQGRHPEDWPSETFSELVDRRGGVPNFPSRMVRSGPWKLWVYRDEDQLPPALFNLDEDPAETQDRVLDPACREIRNQLVRKVLADWDPREVSAAAQDLSASFRTIAAWGMLHRPKVIDSLRVPSPDIEDDIELL